jgi:hypothetical protein
MTDASKAATANVLRRRITPCSIEPRERRVKVERDGDAALARRVPGRR